MLQWHQRVEACEDAGQLLGVAREFLAGWKPQDLAAVPAQARPTQVKGIDDIAYWHQRLVDCYVTGAAQGQGSEQVRGMLHFFSLAIQRASELGGAPPAAERDGVGQLFSERSVPKLFTSAMTGAGDS